MKELIILLTAVVLSHAGLNNRYFHDTSSVSPNLELLSNYGNFSLGGYAKLAGAVIPDEQSGFVLFGADAKFESEILRSHINFELYTVDTLENYNNRVPREFEYNRFIVARHEPIYGAFDFNMNLRTAWLEAYYKGFSLRVGKQNLRWGPGYKSTLSESGTSIAPFYFYHLTQKVGNVLELQAFLRGYEDDTHLIQSTDPLYTVNRGPFTSTFNGYPPRYGAGQQIKVNIRDRFTIGLYELIDFFGTNELVRYANPFQVYYLGNNATKNNYGNMMGGMFLEWKNDFMRAYTEFINDDITVFEKTGNPDKYAFQVGSEYLGKGIVKRAGAEYSHITRYTFGHYSVMSRHSHWDLPIGWAWGNDMDNINLHLELQPHEKVDVRVEGNYWILGQKDLTDDWYYDGKPNRDNAPFFPESPDHLFSMLYDVSYSPFKWLNVECVWRPYWFNKEFSNELRGYLTVKIPTKKQITLGN